MAIKYKVIQKTQPGVPGGGRKKFYAAIVIDGEALVSSNIKPGFARRE
jgi:hypothetical protein